MSFPALQQLDLGSKSTTLNLTGTSGEASVFAARRLPPAIDLVHLSRQTMGDRELEIELLQMFDHQATLVLLRLRGHGQGATQDRCDLAHKLKGSARAIGAVDVAAAAQAYEDSLLAGHAVAASDIALAALSTRIEEARAAILQLLEGA